MTSLADLVDDVLAQIQGYGASSDNVTSLSEDIDIDDTTLVVDDATGISAGLIEIGDELMWVRSYDEASNSVTILPRGRGWRGSTAAAHATGDTVVVSPTVSRHRVKRALEDTVNAIWPTVFDPVATEFVYTDRTQLAWEMPADAEIVLDVSYRDVLGDWQRIRFWELEQDVSTTDFATGNSLRIASRVPVGQTVRVIYGRRPAVLSADASTLATSGLAESARELLQLGAVARLLPALDIGRLPVTNAAAAELDQPKPLGSAVSLAKTVEAQFQAALAREQASLHRKYPGRIHFVR